MTARIVYAEATEGDTYVQVALSEQLSVIGVFPVGPAADPARGRVAIMQPLPAADMQKEAEWFAARWATNGSWPMSGAFTRATNPLAFDALDGFLDEAAEAAAREGK